MTGDAFLVIVGVLYIGASGAYAWHGNAAMAVVMSSYAIANFALILAAK